MGRIAFALRVEPDQVGDLRKVAADLNSAFDGFVATRRELGLTSLSAWLQTAGGEPIVIVLAEGDLERYF